MGLLLVPMHSFAQEGVSQLNDWVGNQLAANESGIGAYLFLLIGGALASLLPCVYPLYPITINILKNRGSESSKFVHPLTYYSGIAAIYFLFGIIAAFTGGAFNTILRLPLFNLSVGLLIFVLGLASAELLHIPFFKGTSGDTKNKGLFGTFSMGLSAGLLSSACVGPIVVSILLGVLSTSSGITLGLLLNAAMKMMLFGLGVGLPLLLMGVFGASLPKAGKWMKYVQYVLAAVIIFFSYGYIEKGLTGFGLTNSQSLSIVIGALILLVAAYQYQSDGMPFQKMRKALLLLAVVSGGMVMARAMLPGISTNATVAQAAGREPSTEQIGNLTFYLDKEAAFEKARQTGKLVFMDFHGDWCTNCKEFQKLIQKDEEINAALQNAVLYKVYDTTPDFKGYAEDSRFPELKIGLPFFAIVDSDENLIYKTTDYLATDEMALFLE